MNSKNINKFAIFLSIVCFFTNLSQLPGFVTNGITQYLSYPGWILLVYVLFLKGMIRFGDIEIKIIFIGILFFISIVISNVFSPFNHFSSNLITPFYFSLVILLLGLFSSHSIKEEYLKLIAKNYIISAFIISLSIYYEYFLKGFNWLSQGYIYSSKNSVSQIILTAFIFLYLIFKPNRILFKLIRWTMLIFWLFLLLALKSRATISGIFVMILMIVFFSKLKIKTKVITASLFIIAVLISIIIPEIRNIIIDGILLGNREGSSLNDISSGRISQITILFPTLIRGNELFGTGHYYVENFMLNAILKHGIFFGWILIAVALWPLIWGFKNINKSDPTYISFLIIAAVYFTDGLFEAQTPLGPGSKNYILWFMFGILYRLSKRKQKPEQY